MKRAWILIGLIFLISACSQGRMREESTPSATGSTLSPAVSETMLPTGSETSAANVSPEPENTSGVYNVYNYEEFINAIGSNREIHLNPGNYDMSKSESGPKVFSALENLTIVGYPDEGMYIQLMPIYPSDTVLTFMNCKAITIKNVDFSHSETKDYEGNGLALTGCEDILLVNCKMAGCGYAGIVLENMKNFLMRDSELEDCSFASVYLTGDTDNVRFEGCTFKHSDLAIWPNNGAVTFKNCIILSQNGTVSTLDELYPVGYPTNLESDWGSEDWKPSEDLYAVYYQRDEGGFTNYEYTYDGNEDVYKDGRFTDLAHEINKISNLIAVSMDLNTEDGNKTLKIHFMDGSARDTLDSLITRQKSLKGVMEYIKDLDLPVRIFLHDEGHSYTIYTVLGFKRISS